MYALNTSDLTRALKLSLVEERNYFLDRFVPGDEYSFYILLARCITSLSKPINLIFIFISYIFIFIDLSF